MAGLLEELWWRYRSCPRTAESAARDFLLLRNPERLRVAMAEPEVWYDFYATDFKRRIATTYGLVESYNVGMSNVWSPVWNRRLLAEAGPGPEVAAERILRRVCELARLHRPTPPGEVS